MVRSITPASSMVWTLGIRPAVGGVTAHSAFSSPILPVMVAGRPYPATDAMPRGLSSSSRVAMFMGPPPTTSRPDFVPLNKDTVPELLNGVPRTMDTLTSQ